MLLKNVSISLFLFWSMTAFCQVAGDTPPPGTENEVTGPDFYREKITLTRTMKMENVIGLPKAYGIKANTLNGRVDVLVYTKTMLDDSRSIVPYDVLQQQGFLSEDREDFLGDYSDALGLLEAFYSEGHELGDGYVHLLDAEEKQLFPGAILSLGYWAISAFLMPPPFQVSDIANRPLVQTNRPTNPESVFDNLLNMREVENYKIKYLSALSHRLAQRPELILPGTAADQTIDVTIEIIRDPEVPLTDIEEIDIHGEIITQEQLLTAEKVFVYGPEQLSLSSASNRQVIFDKNPLGFGENTKVLLPEGLQTSEVNAYDYGVTDQYFYLAAKNAPSFFFDDGRELTLGSYYYDDLQISCQYNGETFSIYRIKEDQWTGEIGAEAGQFLLGNNLNLIVRENSDLALTATDIQYTQLDDELQVELRLRNDHEHNIGLQGPISLTISNSPNITVTSEFPLASLANNQVVPEPGSDGIVFSIPLEQLEPGSHRLSLTYQASTSQDQTFSEVTMDLPHYRKHHSGELTTYEITKTNHQGVPVYLLAGGMSQEYAIQKSIAELTHGVSHTWAIDKSRNPESPYFDQLDLEQGPPLPVWGDKDFLHQSIEKTIGYYDTYVPNQTFETVIIAPGVANVPYLSLALRAPVLPLHFLVTTKRISDVKGIVDQANESGYSAFATAGYDPSMPQLGVSWIKLLELPQQYLDFLSRRGVQNVVIVGADDHGSIGERDASRVLFSDTDRTLALNDYQAGDVYVMAIGGEEGEQKKMEGFADYEYLRNHGFIFDRGHILDWEASVADRQIANFSNSLESSDISVYSLTGTETLPLYQLATFTMQALLDKNSATDAERVATQIDLNEYLIGYPGYEFHEERLPYLYWQTTPPILIGERLLTYVYDLYRSLGDQYDKEYIQENIPLHINAKHEARLKIQSELTRKTQEELEEALSQELALEPLPESDPAVVQEYSVRRATNANKYRFEAVTINDWRKADVWNPEDGMEAPCEKVVEAIDEIGYETYKNALESKQYLTIEDLIEIANLQSTTRDFSRLSGHPHHNPGKTVNYIDDNARGLKINETFYEPSPYWQTTVRTSQVALREYEGEVGRKIGDIGVNQYGEQRYQRVVITEFDLNNTSDDLDLDIGYRMNISPENTDQLLPDDEYDETLGNQQKMSCFEWVLVPKNEWMDIPSRVMEQEGALVIWNGTVYDFDYNGMPGVVPFIKMEDPVNEDASVVKAQPEILSYKNEAYFAWDWTNGRDVTVGARQKEFATEDLGDLFKETLQFPNAMSGMTHMSWDPHHPNDVLDIKRLQPNWMVDNAGNYLHNFPKYLLGPSGTAVRCYTAGRLFGNACDPYIQKNGLAPESDGYNQCTSLNDPDKVERISALAYRQHEKLFDEFANARTYVALTENQDKLHIGIIDGDMGQFNFLGPHMTKTMGMHNWEVANFVQHRKYSHFMHLDGGSSSQMWIAGRGPLQDPNGYQLKNDNQGPYNSRLVSSYLMLKPVLKAENVPLEITNNQHLLLRNAHISFDYSDGDARLRSSGDRLKKKSFVSLSPSLDLLRSPSGDGSIEMKFKIDPSSSPDGAILFGMGEDMYYPDTEGVKLVVPQARNLMVLGVGKVPAIIRNFLAKAENFSEELDQALKNGSQLYFITMRDGNIGNVVLSGSDYNALMDGEWHRLEMTKYADPALLEFYLDDEPWQHPEELEDSEHNLFPFSAHDEVNYAYLGAANINGRFVTGNANLYLDDVSIAIGQEATENLEARRYEEQNLYFMQFEEPAESFHTFSLPASSNSNEEVIEQYKQKRRLYGLNVNVQYIQTNSAAARMQDDSLVEEDAAKEDAEESKPSIPAESVHVYPNQTDGSLIINLVSSFQEPLDLALVTMEGRIVWYHQLVIADGFSSIPVELPGGLANGIYILQLKSTSIDHSARIILNR